MEESGGGPMRKTLALLGFLFSIPYTYAGTSTGAAWMGMPTDAQTAALAGATGAWNEGVNSLGVNTAGLAYTKDNEVLFTQDFWAQQVSQQHLGFSHEFSPKVSVALLVDYLSFGNIDSYLISAGGSPVANGTISPNAMNLGVGCGVKLSTLFSLGGDVRMVREDLTGTAGSTAAGGFGFLMDSHGFKAGLSVANVGGQLNGADLPMKASVSASYRIALDKPTGMKTISSKELGLMAQGDVGMKDSSQTVFGVGAEYRYAEILSARVGYRGQNYGELTGLKGLTMGIGLKVKKMELSYALVTMGDFGKSNLITLTAGF